MNPIRVGIRELRTHLSAYMKEVKSGYTVVVTEHGRPIGRILPLAQPIEERIHIFLESGLAKWSGRKLVRRIPTVRSEKEKTVAELLLQDRE
ncbi:MAG: type II toxin-antitoxin system Phd/YefM family antitoxin [Acidobacteriota bacterium]